MVTTAKDDPEHREASAWAGKGANALGLSGPVDPEAFKAILEGRVPDGPRLGKRGKNSEIHRDIGTSRPNHLSIVDDIHPLPDAVEDLDLVLAPDGGGEAPQADRGLDVVAQVVGFDQKDLHLSLIETNSCPRPTVLLPLLSFYSREFLTPSPSRPCYPPPHP